MSRFPFFCHLEPSTAPLSLHLCFEPFRVYRYGWLKGWAQHFLFKDIAGKSLFWSLPRLKYLLDLRRPVARIGPDYRPVAWANFSRSKSSSCSRSLAQAPKLSFPWGHTPLTRSFRLRCLLTSSPALRHPWPVPLFSCHAVLLHSLILPTALRAENSHTRF